MQRHYRHFAARLNYFEIGSNYGLIHKGGSVIPSRSFHRLAPLVDHLLMALVKPGSHLPYCPNYRSLL